MSDAPVQPSAAPVPDRPVVFVLFGATGDLSRRMVLPGLVELHARDMLPRGWRLVASGRRSQSDEEFREYVGSALEEFGGGAPPDWDEVRGHLTFAGGGFTTEDPGELLDALARARDELGGEVQVVHVLAVPPTVFGPMAEAIGEHGLAEGSRVVFEKPYGTSLESFEELERTVKGVFVEEQVFRIDHFLGKEAVQSMYALRFANELVGGAWNREHVAQVQIDVPEDLDIADRAEFYDSTGAALDMLVTHLFQVAAQVAMEPPSDLRDPAALLAAREAVISSFRPLDPDEVVLGQVEGYRETEGVDPGSRTDTFVAARLWVDTERWRDVPFVLRTGKRMARSAQQVTLVLRPPRGPLMDEVEAPDTIQVSIAGAGAVSFGLSLKTPGPVDFGLSQAEARLELGDVPGGEPMSPYASLLLDALTGDRSMFTTEQGLRAAFRAFAPLQGERRPDPLPYEPDAWGPAEARSVAAPHRWFLGQ
ncbi:glucose-6-phosphate dehydrogenase [Georgenia sp. H159]|uniref:glucose-6-phosphate dehydrogenase n=1 Tax=Georgenia sp. H159 TaxID=3076115 RepID=UPI002D78E907|nr:glucose-6-phosphate dehydrogenase [Georgenia sp. H159]